ncbi:MAG: hypothetical protein IPP74_15875 [Alphaproteobacteria bacterium]|nr:hypothetical protein [Alphaproteobacteria bacterium]
MKTNLQDIYSQLETSKSFDELNDGLESINMRMENGKKFDAFLHYENGSFRWFHFKEVVKAKLLGIRTVYDVDPTKTFRIADILTDGALLPHSVTLAELMVMDLEPADDDEEKSELAFAMSTPVIIHFARITATRRNSRRPTIENETIYTQWEWERNMNDLTVSNTVDAAIMESVLLGGDLSKLTPEQRVSYYRHVCESVGLNPLTKPFDYMTLNGKLTLYAKKDATDQLRNINGVSIDDVDIVENETQFLVKVKGHDKTGRTDVEIGVVAKKDMQGNLGNVR